MKKILFLVVLFLIGKVATANVVIDSVKTTTDSVKVFFSWNFNTPDTSGYVSVQIATNQSFTSGVISPALVYASGDAGNAVYIFTNA
jgi:predicted nucleotide-binding protein